MPPTPTATSPWRWDVFCRVVDNFGDVGVCRRLARDLGARGHAVRWWIDDASALAWMAPGGDANVEVVPWPRDDAGDALAALLADGAGGPGDVVVEAFGCDPPPAFVGAMADRAMAGRAAPTWINLEYLSAEPYVERSHGLRSPQMSGPGRGLDKWFFYPGFTARTGGLLREPGLVGAQAAFDARAWRAAHGLALEDGERLASVFCYPGADLGAMVDALARGGERWCLAAAPGTLGQVPGLGPGSAIDARPGNGGAWPEARHLTRVVALPWLDQDDFDRLLWSSDLNLVRGEDSFARAQWAGRPALWHIYPQDDGVHVDKLDAFLDTWRRGAKLAGDDASFAEWKALHHAWNAVPGSGHWPAVTPALRTAVQEATLRWRDHLLEGADLVSRLIAFVAEKR